MWDSWQVLGKLSQRSLNCFIVLKGWFFLFMPCEQFYTCTALSMALGSIPAPRPGLSPARCLMFGAGASPAFPAPGWSGTSAIPAGSPRELSMPPVSDPKGSMSLCGTQTMGMIINNIFIKKNIFFRLFPNLKISQKETCSSTSKLRFTRLYFSLAICIQFNSTKWVVNQLPHSESSKYFCIINRH